jgi:hypothetical protein
MLTRIEDIGENQKSILGHINKVRDELKYNLDYMSYQNAKIGLFQ